MQAIRLALLVVVLHGATVSAQCKEAVSPAPPRLAVLPFSIIRTDLDALPLAVRLDSMLHAELDHHCTVFAPVDTTGWRYLEELATGPQTHPDADILVVGAVSILWNARVSVQITAATLNPARVLLRQFAAVPAESLFAPIGWFADSLRLKLGVE